MSEQFNDSIRPRRRLVLGLAVALVGLTTGCAAPSVDRIEIRGDQYDEAFAAAQEATRQEGMPPLLADRTGGVIESRPRLAGSVLEPWRVDHGSMEQFAASTLHKQRRRVRFEFLPVAFVPPAASGGEPLVGAPVPGSEEDLTRTTDLANFDGPIEVRIWVWIEREQRSGLRRSTWTRAGKAYTTNPLETIEPGDGTTRSPGVWTPVERDVTMEQRLLAEVAASLGDS